MVTRLVADLDLPLARVRLDAYRPVGGTDEAMVTNYLWNVALSEALYPALGAMEVSLRNSIHAAASVHYRTDHWFDLAGLLQPGQVSAIADARNELRRQGKHPTAGRIIAELRFGFWTTLLSRPYHHPLWNPNQGALLKAVFPHIPAPLRQRHLIHRRYNDLRFLRNRVVHHEPVWNRPFLAAEHRRILEAIGWISPTLVGTVALVDRFPDIHRNGWGRIGAALKRHLAAAPP